MNIPTPSFHRVLSFLVATLLAAPLFAAERSATVSDGVSARPARPAAKGTIPFRHTIIDGSPDLTRPAKAVGDMNGDGFIDIVCGGSNGLFWYDYPTWNKHVIDPGRVEDDFCFCVDMQVGDIIGANWSVWIPPARGQKRVFNGEDPLEIWQNLSARKTTATAPPAGGRLSLDK